MPQCPPAHHLLPSTLTPPPRLPPLPLRLAPLPLWSLSLPLLHQAPSPPPLATSWLLSPEAPLRVSSPSLPTSCKRPTSSRNPTVTNVRIFLPNPVIHDGGKAFGNGWAERDRVAWKWVGFGIIMVVLHCSMELFNVYELPT